MMWKKFVDANGLDLGWGVAEAIHTMNQTTEAFRLVIKRTWRDGAQEDFLICFGTGRWQRVYLKINIHRKLLLNINKKRGNRERFIGELKWELNLEHLPCNSMEPNAVFVGVVQLTFNLLYHLQELMEQSGKPHRKSIRSLR